MLTTRQAAEEKGLSVGRIIQLIHSGEIEARKIMGMWMIDEASLRTADWNRRPGPKKS